MILSIFALPDIIRFSYITRISVIMGFALFYLDKKMTLERKYFIWVLAFSTIGLFNVFFAAYQNVTMKTFATSVQAIWISFMVAHWLKKNREFVLFFNSIIIGGTVLCFRLIRYIDFGSWGERKVSYMLGENVNSLGLRLAIACMFSFFLASCYKTRKKKMIYYAASVLLTLFVLVTGSRRALIIVFMSLCIILVFNTDNSVKRLGAIVKLLFIVYVVYMVLMKVPQFYAIIGSRMERFILAIFSSDSALDNGRDVMIQRSLQLFIERPVLGWGMGCFRYVSGINYVYSHNTYAELLYATGILGFVSYYSILPVMIFRIKSLSKNSLRFIFCVCVVCCMIISDMAAVNYTSLLAHLLIAVVMSITSSEMVDNK